MTQNANAINKSPESAQENLHQDSIATPDIRRNAARLRKLKTLVAYLPLLALIAIYTTMPKARSYASSAFSALLEQITHEEPVQPGPVRAQMIKAAELIWLEKWDEALAIYEGLHTQLPDDSDVSYGLGLCRHNMGDYAGAIDLNLRATDSPSLAPAANFLLAGEYSMTGQSENALTAMQKALHLGYRNYKNINADPALASLRDDPGFSLPPQPEVRSYTLASGKTIKYTLVLPEDYDPGRTYPTLLGFTHSRQSMNADNFALNNYWGLQAYYEGWIVVSPLSPGPGGYTYSDSHRLIPELLDHIQEQFNVEGGKFHLAGFSNGGTTSFKIATEFPDRFQSVTAFPAYDIFDEHYQRLDELKGMKISLFFGGDDGGPSVETSRKIYARAVELGLDVTLTEYPGEGHEVASLMGMKFMDHMEEVREAVNAAATISY